MSTYTNEKLRQLDLNNIPHHIAIIPDGNRRWAKKHLFETFQGHHKGAKTLMDIVKACRDLGVQVVTFYIFSTENWSRPKKEVEALMNLLESHLRDERQNMIDNGVCFHAIGNLIPFPKSVLKELQATRHATKNCDSIDLVFALNYGGRDEIKRAVQKIIDKVLDNTLQRDEISEAVISDCLDTHPWKDPDLLIRTSGEMRVSNFLLWQQSYSEMYSTHTLWPDFTPEHLFDAVADYQKRQRRLGGQ